MDSPGGAPSGGTLPSPDVASMMQQFSSQAGKSGANGGGSGSGGLPAGFPGLPGAKGAGAKGFPGGKGLPGAAGNASSTQRSPRPLGTPLQELNYAAGDVGWGLLSLLPDALQGLFHLKSTDTPEEQAKKKQMLQKFNSLSDQDRQFAVQKFQQQQQKEQALKREEEAHKAQEAKMKQEPRAIPRGRTQGFAPGQGGPGRSKTKSITDQSLWQQRNQVGGSE